MKKWIKVQNRLLISQKKHFYWTIFVIVCSIAWNFYFTCMASKILWRVVMQKFQLVHPLQTLSHKYHYSDHDLNSWSLSNLIWPYLTNVFHAVYPLFSHVAIENLMLVRYKWTFVTISFAFGWISIINHIFQWFDHHFFHICVNFLNFQIFLLFNLYSNTTVRVLKQV